MAKEKTPEILITTPNADLGSTDWRFDIEEAREIYRQLGMLFSVPQFVSIPSIWTEPVLKPPFIVTTGGTAPSRTDITWTTTKNAD